MEPLSWLLAARRVWAWPVGMIGNALLFTVFPGFLCASGFVSWWRTSQAAPQTGDPRPPTYSEAVA